MAEHGLAVIQGEKTSAAQADGRVVDNAVVPTYREKTGDLRWNKGFLEQRYTVRVGKIRAVRPDEWVVVPSVD